MIKIKRLRKSKPFTTIKRYQTYQVMNEYALANYDVRFSAVHFQFVSFRYFFEILRFSLLILQLLIEVIG